MISKTQIGFCAIIYIQDFICSFICDTKLPLYSVLIFGYSMFTIIYRILLFATFLHDYIYTIRVTLILSLINFYLLRCSIARTYSLYKITSEHYTPRIFEERKMPLKNHIERHYNFAITIYTEKDSFYV